MAPFEKKPVKPLPLETLKPVPSDIDIAQLAAENMKPIAELMEEVGLQTEEVEFYGKYKAKIKLEVLDRLKDQPAGKYIDVTAIGGTQPGFGCAFGQERLHLHPPTEPGTNLWYQRRRCRRRLQPGDSHGRLQPAPHR